MINFLRPTFQSIRAIACGIFVLALLQSCGGERSTPYDPQLPSSSSCSSSSNSNSSSSSFDIIELGSSSTSSSSSSNGCSSSSSSSSIISISGSSVSSIEARLIWSGTSTATQINQKEKSVREIRTENDFYSIANAYVNFNLENQNFSEGQVILVDDGEVDSCSARLEFTSRLSAFVLTDNSVKAVLNYVEKPKQENCTSTFSRPFYFYYIQTSKPLILEQKII